MSRLTGEALAQFRVLGGDADWAGVEMAFAHHHATGGDQGGGAEAELVGTEQGADHDITTRAQTTVNLYRDPAA
jgi:hypothetical protein